MKKIFEKNDEVVEVTENLEEVTEMGFFEKYKKGLFIGAIALVTAIAAGVMVAICGDDSDNDEETEESDIFDIDEIEATVEE